MQQTVPPEGGSFPRRPRQVAPASQEAPPQAPQANGAPPLPLRPPPSASREGGREALSSPEAEKSVLGSVLIDPDAIFKVAALLQPDDFYTLAHGQIFAAALTLHHSATPIDLVTLGDELERHGQLTGAGGPAYLAGLMNAVPTAVHAEHYAGIVRARALARRLVEAAGRLAAAGYEHPNDPQGALEALETITTTVRASWTHSGPEPLALEDLRPPLDPDAFLVGGFIRPGTTVMLTGPPGSSKSWAARQLAMECAAGRMTFLGHYAVERPMNVLLVDEDNGEREEWRRDEVLLGTLGLQRSGLGRRLHRVSLAGVMLDSPTWQQWLRVQVSDHQLDLVILDPVSEMHGGKELREDPAFRSMLSFLKRLKVDFPRLATLLVHHTRKQMSGDRTKERSLDDVRGQWGQTPDVVALMWGIGERRVAWELHKRVPHSKLILEASEAGPLTFVADETSSSLRQISTDSRVMASIEAGAATADEIVIGTGLSRSGVFKALKRLAQASLVTPRAPYQLIEEREIQGVEGDG
jgi:hypothetical protein